MKHPTPELYGELDQAYVHFNADLFDGVLPPCVITLQRQKRTLGYFSPDRFVSVSRTTADEIALNPEHFAVKGPTDILQTLVHEMAHLWQHHFGKPGRGRYHNAEWAAKMEAIGLMPSSTGEPGGKRTGDHVSDYVIEAGPFQAALERLLSREFVVSWYDRFPAACPAEGSGIADLLVPPAQTGGEGEKPASRVKYRCGNCGAQVWGKPGLLLACGVPACRNRAFVPVL